METAQIPTCPQCHSSLDITDIFCSTCGTNVKTGDSSVTKFKMAYVIIMTLLLPPFGLIWAFKYIKSPDERIKKFGWIIIGLTVISVIVNVILIMSVLGEATKQIQLLPPEVNPYQGL